MCVKFLDLNAGKLDLNFYLVAYGNTVTFYYLATTCLFQNDLFDHALSNAAQIILTRCLQYNKEIDHRVILFNEVPYANATRLHANANFEVMNNLPVH